MGEGGSAETFSFGLISTEYFYLSIYSRVPPLRTVTLTRTRARKETNKLL